MSGYAQYVGGRVKDWSRALVFGARPVVASWVIRPSAYGLILMEGARMAVVRTSRGVYLPGGGVEGVEMPEEAIKREALEECGLVVEVGVWETYCIQFVYSQAEDTHFEKRSTFIECSPVQINSTLTEADHELVWMRLDEAARLLTPESHCWAVDQWRSRETH
jgi:8-oxo-dGTP diphosphatase